MRSEIFLLNSHSGDKSAFGFKVGIWIQVNEKKLNKGFFLLNLQDIILFNSIKNSAAILHKLNINV